MPQPAPSNAALGAAVRRLRGERGLSQEDLAGAAGIHTTYLSGIERGRRNPSWTVLGALSEALDVSIIELIERAWAEGAK